MSRYGVEATKNNNLLGIPRPPPRYAQGHTHFLEDGIDYWWNDEGETEWFTYLYWNMAQQAQFTAVRPNARHFTINRAFQPGM